jgi:hypothetical protein
MNSVEFSLAREIKSKVMNMKTPMFINAMRSSLLLFLLAACLPMTARAQTSQYMSYQGFLTDGNGNALGSTNTGPKAYDVVFRMWDAATGGNELFSELQTVTVDNGYFSVLLGQGTTYSAEPTLHVPLASVFTNSAALSRYVEMTVLGIGTGGSITILPRLQLVSSPFAFQASSALNITGTNTITAANFSTNLGAWQASGTNIYKLGGNVGIGNSVPGSSLDVNGNIELEGTHLVYNSANAVIDWGSGSLLFRSDSAQGNVGTYTSPMSLSAGGNLTVAGSISAASISGVPTLGGANTFSPASSQTYGSDLGGAGGFSYYGRMDLYSVFGPFYGAGLILHDSTSSGTSTASGGIGYTYFTSGEWSTDAVHNDVTLRSTAGKVLIPELLT